MRLLSIVTLAAVLCGARAAAQDRPDFSGTWSAVTDPAAAPRPALAFGQQFSVHHQGSSLTLTRTMAGGPATVTYTLDGSEIRSRMPGRLCEPDSGATWTAAWDGAAVHISQTGVVAPNGKSFAADVKSVMRFETSDAVRVEVTARTAGQAAPRTTSTLYRKSGGASPAPAPGPAKARATLSHVAWMTGVWVGSSGASTFEERWTPSAGGSMLATSRTLRDGLMSEFEFLCIVERDGGLVYQAMPNGRMPATDFTLTRIEADSATFENPAHDFPTMIRYTRRPDGSLEAVTSGPEGKPGPSFIFRRQP